MKKAQKILEFVNTEKILKFSIDSGKEIFEKHP